MTRHTAPVPQHGAPPLDRRGLVIGEPTALFEGLSRILGTMNLARTNIRVGVTQDPAWLWNLACREHPWRGMRLLWAGRSAPQARLMADLLRHWDAKLYDSSREEPVLDGRTSYAYVLYM